MVVQGSHERNYWHLLAAARQALDSGDFATAERRYQEAVARRESSPGRVFLTERLGDGISRLMGRRDKGKVPPIGRWERRIAGFRTDFLKTGELRVREAVRLAELRPEDNAETNQPVLVAALFLVANSRLFREEPASAVALLKGLVRTAQRTGRTFPVELLRHDLPLAAEDRLWLARKGVAMLEVFLDQECFAPGTPSAHEWTEAVLRLLQPEYFGQGERLDEERAWLEARSADRLLGRAADSITLYRDYLRLRPEPSPRADEARVRQLELQANIDACHFSVPCYDAALGALQSAGLAPGSEAAGRYQAAVSCIEYRRPEGPAAVAERAWASAALTGTGEVAVVFWWGNAPRDLAHWRPGEDISRLESFLSPCQGRLAAADPETVAAIGPAWAEGPGSWDVATIAAVLAAPLDLDSGARGVELDQVATTAAGTWRSDWRRDLGLEALAPGEDGSAGHPACGRAVQAGLVLIALRARVAEADPTLRAGIGEMARRGDPACRFLYAFLVQDDAAARAVDEAFAPWTLPLLWTRPFPAPAGPAPVPQPEGRVSPDLARNPLAIVSTGRPAPVLAAWCAGQHRWRVVLDRMDRLPELLSVVQGAGGPVTVVPPGGGVHDLEAALGLLDDLLPGGGAAADAGLLPLCHWSRLVTTHNGDLLDAETVRPRVQVAGGVLEQYADLVDALPRVSPGDVNSTWSEQFVQRVRRAGCVLGLAGDLPEDPARLDALWGVFEGSGASWVFLDAAAIRGAAGTGDDSTPAHRHELLHARGDRLLAVLTGAVWCRTDVEDLLAEEASLFGPAAVVALTDLRPPPLVLADRGIAADARVLRADALAAAVEYLDRAVADDRLRLVRPPPAGPGGAFWREAARALPGVQPGWQVDGTLGPAAAGRPGTVLCLPSLPGLDGVPSGDAGTSAEQWREADELRRLALVAARRRASLELAAHLAGRWDAVEVLDPRWWHLGRPAGAAEAKGWNGERAAAALAPGGCRSFDLPGGGGREPAAPGARVAAVRAWCDARQDLPPVEPASADIHGIRLEIGRDETTAQGLQSAVQAGREAGSLDRWLLVVSGSHWPAMESAVATCSTPGATVWTAGAEALAPGPVLWMRPADLLEPSCAEFLAAMPPSAVVVPDLDTWLPGGRGDSRVAASALRVLLRIRPPAVLLQARALPDAWSRYLVAAAGVDTVEAESDAEAAGPVEFAPTLPPAALILRLRRFLGRLRPLLEQRALDTGEGGPRHLVSARELISLDRLGQLTGLPPETVRDGIQVLRWVASLAGENLSTADAEPPVRTEVRVPGHALLVKRRFAECEAALAELADHLDLFLPLWLGDLPAGGATWIDLAAPPAELDPRSLRRLDAFLLGAGILPYTAPRGVLGSTRRLLRLEQTPAATLTALHAGLDLFRTRLRDVMETAVETADGFVVETGLVELREDERAFLGLGAALDEWRWLGPVTEGALHVVDLLTLADSATAADKGDPWALVGDLYGAQGSDPEAEQEEAPRRVGWRSLLPGGERGRDGFATARLRVADLAAAAGESNFVVLRGLAGTGRLEAVLEGLDLAGRRGADAGDVVVCCPDTGTAARVARAAAVIGLLPDLRVPDREELPPAAPDDPLGEAARTDVVVMCEAQRFGAELRYRVAQFGRGRRLVMTADPAAAAESWENLFLTTPRASDVLDLDAQIAQTRRLWTDTRALVPDAVRAQAGSRRNEKGQVVAEYAANLDQCLARLRTALDEGLLPDRFRLTAPLAEDLDHLRAALRNQGWFAVDEAECDALCLPGPSEVLALAAAALQTAGAPDPARQEPAEDEEGEGPRDTGVVELLGSLPGAGPDAADWVRDLAPDPRGTTLADLQSLADRAGILPVLALPSARARVADLLATWGDRPLTALVEEPLWAAWRRTVGRDMGPDPMPGRPLVLLNPAARPPGTRMPGGVYLCLGTEDDRQHYRVLSGVTDDLLVLFQERSPLPSDAEDGDGRPGA